MKNLNLNDIFNELDALRTPDEIEAEAELARPRVDNTLTYDVETQEVDGSKVYNTITFKGLDKTQTATIVKSLNKALPALNKKLEKVFTKS